MQAASWGGGVVLLWLRNGLHVRGRLLAAFQRSHVHEADNTPERVADGEPHAPADRVRRVDAYAIAQANCSADSAAIGPSEPKLSRPGLSLAGFRSQRRRLVLSDSIAALRGVQSGLRRNVTAGGTGPSVRSFVCVFAGRAIIVTKRQTFRQPHATVR